MYASAGPGVISGFFDFSVGFLGFLGSSRDFLLSFSDKWVTVLLYFDFPAQCVYSSYPPISS